MASRIIIRNWLSSYTFGAEPSTRDSKAKFWITTSGFSYSYWGLTKTQKDLGFTNYYTVQSPQKRLEKYSSDFDTFEINVTRYRKLTPQMVQKWIPYFRKIIIKAPLYITHQKKLNDVEDWWAYFQTNYYIIPPEKRGPILFQFAATFHPTEANMTKLMRLKATLPTDIQIAVEFRHGAWFDKFDTAMLELFANPNWTTVMVDSSGDSNTFGDMPMGLSANLISFNKEWAYLRLHGQDGFCLGSYDDEQLANYYEALTDKGFREIYVAFNNTDSWNAEPRQQDIHNVGMFGLLSSNFPHIQPSAISDGLRLQQIVRKNN